MEKVFYLSTGEISERDKQEIEKMIKDTKGDIEAFRETFRMRFNFLPNLYTQKDPEYENIPPEYRLVVNPEALN